MYTNLIAAMRVKNVPVERLAKTINRHRNTVANKLSGESEFTFAEAMLICEEIFPEYRPSYLFHNTVETGSVEFCSEV